MDENERKACALATTWSRDLEYAAEHGQGNNVHERKEVFPDFKENKTNLE